MFTAANITTENPHHSTVNRPRHSDPTAARNKKPTRSHRKARPTQTTGQYNYPRVPRGSRGRASSCCCCALERASQCVCGARELHQSAGLCSLARVTLIRCVSADRERKHVGSANSNNGNNPGRIKQIGRTSVPERASRAPASTATSLWQQKVGRGARASHYADAVAAAALCYVGLYALSRVCCARRRALFRPCVCDHALCGVCERVERAARSGFTKREGFCALLWGCFSLGCRGCAGFSFVGREDLKVSRRRVYSGGCRGLSWKIRA